MKKYQICLHKSGKNNTPILEMIAYANEGRSRLSFIDLVGYINATKARYPIADEGFSYVWDTRNPNGTTLHISEDNCETFTISVTQIELHELANVVTISETFYNV